jgi:hypothetical protein
MYSNAYTQTAQNSFPPLVIRLFVGEKFPTFITLLSRDRQTTDSGHLFGRSQPLFGLYQNLLAASVRLTALRLSAIFRSLPLQRSLLPDEDN